MTAVYDIMERLVDENDRAFYNHYTMMEIKKMMDDEDYDGDELKVGSDDDELLSEIDNEFIPILKEQYIESTEYEEDIDDILQEAGLIVKEEDERHIIAYKILKKAWYNGTWRQATLSNIKHHIHATREKNFVWKQLTTQ